MNRLAAVVVDYKSGVDDDDDGEEALMALHYYSLFEDSIRYLKPKL